MKARLWNSLRLAIGLGLLYLLFTRLEDPAALWQQIANANPWLLAAGACCYAGAVALSGLKWGVLLRAVGIPVPPRRLLAYQWLAEFFNNFLPAQVGGDVMRGYALASDTKRRADAAASILIDRFIGLLVFVAAAAVAAVAMLIWGRATLQDVLSVQVIALGSGAATLLLFGVLAAMLSRRLKTLAEWLIERLPFATTLLPIWKKLADAFNAYRYRYRALVITALCSALIVVLTSINIWLIARAIAPGQIALNEVLAINPIIVFVSLFFPFLPGGLGVRQGVFQYSFHLIGADGTLGFAVGLLQQLIGYVVSLPGGYLWVRGGGRQQPTPTALPPDAPVRSQLG